MRVINTTRGTVIAEHAMVANGFFARAKGLLGKDSLTPQSALLIPRCQSIHMFFMKFSIDVIFVNREGYIVGLVTEIHPFQFSPVFWKSDYAIELPKGQIAKASCCLGDFVSCEAAVE